MEMNFLCSLASIVSLATFKVLSNDYAVLFHLGAMMFALGTVLRNQLLGHKFLHLLMSRDWPENTRPVLEE
jgi:hypothetical protein